jgi:hypothetical protein
VAKCGNMSKLPLWNHCGDIKMPYTPVAIAIVVETSKSYINCSCNGSYDTDVKTFAVETSNSFILRWQLRLQTTI